ncbi:hypothetical protein [Geoglobus acetivorans]|uniref:Restriction endonuclease n=1 Tax=Geoglobus acetivorans TaxID=565033 RepID=A0ABZ3H219_GEOAI|nr:hypothetical protein [Geoglobus acetivorans]
MNELIRFNKETCNILWSLPDVDHKPILDCPRLIIPSRRDKHRRISEQEARFVFCSILNNSDFFYSIETPTEKKYKMSGEGMRSASTDLTIYEYRDGFRKLVNVEFKAHNPRFREVEKDIKKLVGEEPTGNWFHLLKNVNSMTLKALFGKIKNALIKNYSDSISILFCFCVLDKKWACMKHFNWSGSELPQKEKQEKYRAFVEEFFRLDYFVRREVIVVDENGWIVYSN